MRKLILVLPVILAFSTTAHAGVSLDAISTGASACGANCFAPDFGAVHTITFDDGGLSAVQPSPFSSGGYLFTGGGAVVTGNQSNPNSYAAPAGDGTQYLSTGFNGQAGTFTESVTFDQVY